MARLIKIIENLRLSGHSHDWYRLRSNNNKFYASNIVLEDFGDIHPIDGIQLSCENLYLHNCNKNFIFYWLNKKTFPDTKNVYLLSHPCDRRVLFRNFDKIYLSNKQHIERFAECRPNVIYVDYNKIKTIIDNIKNDDLTHVEKLRYDYAIKE